MTRKILYTGKHHLATYRIYEENGYTTFSIRENVYGSYYGLSKKQIRAHHSPNRIKNRLHKISSKTFIPLIIIASLSFAIGAWTNINILIWVFLISFILLFPISYFKMGLNPEWEIFSVPEAIDYTIQEIRRMDLEKDQLEFKAEQAKIQIEGVIQEKKILQEIEQTLLT